jgi:hypothetical protein
MRWKAWSQQMSTSNHIHVQSVVWLFARPSLYETTLRASMENNRDLFAVVVARCSSGAQRFFIIESLVNQRNVDDAFFAMDCCCARVWFFSGLMDTIYHRCSCKSVTTFRQFILDLVKNRLRCIYLSKLLDYLLICGLWCFRSSCCVKGVIV